MRLVPPCGYKGGKRKHSQRIAEEILAYEPKHVYDCCSGSGAVSLSLIEAGYPPSDITMVEAGPWALFWTAVSDGSLDLPLLRRWLVDEAPEPKDTARWLLEEIATQPPSPEAFLVLQAGSYGGTPVWWDGGQWRRGSHTTNRLYKPRAYWEPGPDSSETKPRGTIFRPDKILTLCEIYMKRCVGMKALHCLVEAVEWDRCLEGTAVYIDPDYGDTSGYGWSVAVPQFIENSLRPLFISEQVKVPGADRYVDVGLRRGANITKSSSKSSSTTQEWLSIWGYPPEPSTQRRTLSPFSQPQEEQNAHTI